MKLQAQTMVMGDGGAAAYFDHRWRMMEAAHWILRYRGAPMAAPRVLDNKLGIGYFSWARGFHDATGTLLLYSREVWPPATIGEEKTEGYVYWRHLSLSFHETDLEAGPNRYGRMRECLPKDEETTARWIEAFFGAQKVWVICEPPSTDNGRKFDVWHYRMPCDPNWEPLARKGSQIAQIFSGAGWHPWLDLAAERRRPS